MLIPFAKPLILLFLLLITACVANDKHDTVIESSALQASPDAFLQGESVLLTFPQKHPKNLAVRNPDGIWYSIHSPDDEVSILTLDDYNTMTELVLHTQTLEGIAWINGVKRKEKVFEVKGEYLVYMADNLETEPENTFYFMTKIIFNK